MPRSSDKRERLIEAAKSLIHRRGFHRTTLADIAAESAVPLGDQDPRANLKRFLRHLMADSDEVAECGCPHGTLSQELRKMSSPLTGRAEGTLQVLIDWAAGQFRRAGVARPKSTGFGFIARVQGTMMLTHALHDPKRLKQQFKYIGEWLDTL
ncbi:MAG: helix-turn-helix domain containing protein [Gammaproteobacteria bacterium]